MLTASSRLTVDTRPVRWLVVAQWGLVLAALAYAGLLLAGDRVHLLDLPYWVYEGAAVRAKVLGVATGAAAAFPLKTYPVPNSATQILLALTVGPLGPVGAGRLVAAGLLLASIAAFYALATRLHGSEGVLRAVVLAVTLAASASYWNGYLNFQLGLTVLAVYGALRAKHGLAARPSTGLTLGASLMLFACHSVPFFAFAVGAGVEALWRRDARLVLALVPAAGLSAWYVLAQGSGDASVTEGYPDLVTFGLYKAYTVLKLGPFVHFLGADGTGFLDGSAALYGLLAAGAAVFVAVLGVALVRGAAGLRGATEPEARARRWVVVLALVLAALALPVPPVWLSVVNLGERLLAVALLLLVAVVPLRRRTLACLAMAAVPFVVNDLAALAFQAPPPAATVEADLARREAAGTGRQTGQFAGYLARQQSDGAARFPWLGRNRFDQAAYYLALERGRWTLPLPSTGLIEGTDP